MRTSYDAAEVQRAIDQLVARVASAFKPDQPLNVVGIRTRGEILAQRLIKALRERGFSRIGRTRTGRRILDIQQPLNGDTWHRLQSLLKALF